MYISLIFKDFIFCCYIINNQVYLYTLFGMSSLHFKTKLLFFFLDISFPPALAIAFPHCYCSNRSSNSKSHRCERSNWKTMKSSNERVRWLSSSTISKWIFYLHASLVYIYMNIKCTL